SYHDGMNGRTDGRTRRRVARENPAPYGVGTVDKVSISLPPGLVARARAQADREESSLSAVVAAALRDQFDREDQARLDAALDADREEGIRAAEAFLPYSAALFAEAEW
ncbi:MAG TPA: hypothetical protein VF323_01925, partial [Candidatus Limnocylindrales bacterium]